MATEGKKLEGVAPAIVKMTKESTNFYVGRTLWFGIAFAYFALIYVMQDNWFYLAQDFKCHGTLSRACLAECYENQFSFPVIGVWYMFGFVFSSIFAFMEFFVTQKIHKHKKLLRRNTLDQTTLLDVDRTCDTMSQEAVFEIVKEKQLWVAYLIYFLVQIFVQVVFLFVLIQYQLPLIAKPISCSTPLCLGPYACVVLETQEKRIAIILMILLSAIIMTFCITFLLYTISMHLVNKRFRIRKQR